MESRRRCLGDDEKGFDVVRALPFQPLGALQPVERGIAAAGPDIGLADLRMRGRFPGLFEDRGGLAHAAFAEQRLCGNEGGRNEIGGKLQRLQGVVAGTRRVAFQLLGGARRQEDGVQTVGFGLFDDAGGLLLFEQADRIIPAAGLAAIFERRLCRPGKVRRVVGSLFGILAGRFIGPETAGFQIEAAQAKLARLWIVGHGLELGTRLIMAAFDQGGLGLEQVDQWFLIGADEATRAGSHLTGEQRIAGAGGDQAGRQCLITAVPLAGAEITRHRIR